MPEKDVPGSIVSPAGNETSGEAQVPVWTYDSWFAGWYRTPREAEAPLPALAE